MGKRGVSKIEGPSTIKLGEEVVYSISRVHRKEDIAKGKYAQWILYVEESGKWRELKRHPNLPPKIGDTTTLVITNQNLLGKRLLLEAYMYSPEKTAPPGIIIKVEKGGKKKIEDIQLLMADEKTPITKKTVMRYGQSIIVKVQSVNMQKEKVTIYLYEDDEKGKGHSVKNEKNLVAQVEKIFDDNGLITHTFKLPIDFSKIANTYLDGDNDPHHEYYIHIKSEGLSKTSVNFEVLNPEYIEQEGKIAKVVIIGKAKGIGTDPILDTGKSTSMVGEEPQENKGHHCGEKFCIKKGDKNELIREVNIRLAGFGGNVPTDEFTERTEKMIKQFQRDYMEVPETGKICGNVLRAIDEFQSKYIIDFTELKCKCKTCSGFGDGSNKGKYLKGNTEAYHRYEYPGIHRSLLSSIRSVKFYLEKDGRYSFNKINSGYRCRYHPEYLKKPTTNHMGKALDLHFNDTTGRTRKVSDMEAIRKDIFNKYLGAKWDWKERNIFNLESTDVGATTWVHYDVREFDTIYLEDEFFVKNLTGLNGKSMVSLAIELGFTNTCSCLGRGMVKSKEKDTTKKDNKYKWAHSDFGNLIAKKESSDDYNKCNRTKGGLKVVNDIEVVSLTIREIQEKQKNRDIFAVGRYQLIPSTLNSAVLSLGLDIDEKLDEEMQDKIFDEYLIKVKRPKIISYLEGEGKLEDAMYSAAQEWASIGVEKGKRISDKIVKDKNGKITRVARYAQGGESYYAGDGLNKSHITPEQIKNVLIKSKDGNK